MYLDLLLSLAYKRRYVIAAVAAAAIIVTSVFYYCYFHFRKHTGCLKEKNQIWVENQEMQKGKVMQANQKKIIKNAW